MVDLRYLADEPRHLPILAEWLHAQWGALDPGSTVETRAAKMRSQLQHRAVPCCFVAVEADRPVGSASLVEHDLETHLEWSPWLASVYVRPEARRRGIGSALVERVVAEARALAVPSLYLFTPDQQGLYARLGWRAILDEPTPHGEITVMVRDLAEG